MLADLLPLVGSIKRPPLTSAERFKRWREKNRDQWNAYRRNWYAKNKPGNV